MLTEAVVLAIIGAITTVVGYFVTLLSKRQEAALEREQLNIRTLKGVNDEQSSQIEKLLVRIAELEESREESFLMSEREKRRARHAILLLNQELSIYKTFCEGCKAVEVKDKMPSVEDLLGSTNSLSRHKDSGGVVSSEIDTEPQNLRESQATQGFVASEDKRAIETDEDLANAFARCCSDKSSCEG